MKKNENEKLTIREEGLIAQFEKEQKKLEHFHSTDIIFGEKISKKKIFYHRSYRKLNYTGKSSFFLQYFFLALIPDLMIISFFSDISKFICDISKFVLSSSIPEYVIKVVEKPFLFQNTYILVLPGSYPTLRLSLIVAIVSFSILFFAVMSRNTITPNFVWFVYISFINLVSALFFIFFIEYFPYDLEIFSEMYFKTIIGMWIIIPNILSLAIIPLPARIIEKFALIGSTLLYSMLFALVRYVAFLYLLRSFSYIFMALVFFMFGPFLDFLYIVGIYSLYLDHVGKINKKKELEVWNWSF